MKQEYLEELINFSDKDKIITMELIEKIIYDIVKEEYRFNEVIFNNTNWSNDVMCSCDIVSRNIIVDYKNIDKEYNKSKRNSLQKNLIILSYLFHEVNHLKEEKIMELSNFESLLIAYSSFDIIGLLADKKIKHMKYLINDELYIKILETKQDRLYLKIYDKIPGERIANIRSYKEVLESIYNYPNFKEKYNGDLEEINKIYIKQYYLGYDNYKKQEKYYPGPLLDYLKFIKKSGLLENLYFSNKNTKLFLETSSKKFTIEERMLYGLPVTLEETKVLDKKLMLTK